jgi:hypothetical protein
MNDFGVRPVYHGRGVWRGLQRSESPRRIQQPVDPLTFSPRVPSAGYLGAFFCLTVRETLIYCCVIGHRQHCQCGGRQAGDGHGNAITNACAVSVSTVGAYRASLFKMDSETAVECIQHQARHAGGHKIR